MTCPRSPTKATSLLLIMGASVVLLLSSPGVPVGESASVPVPSSATAGPRDSPTLEPLPATAPGPMFDWPTYLANDQRTGANPNESVLADANASSLRVLWMAATPGVIESSPVVAGGVVYVTSWDGSVSAYNLTNGTLRWRTFVGTSTFPSCYFSTARGPTSTPTVENGTVYVLGGDPYFYALDAANGSILWKVAEGVNSPNSGNYNWASPLVVGSSAVFGVASACGSPGSQGVIEEVNLNGSTHSITHVFDVVPTGTVLGGVWSTPSYDPASNTVWVTTGDGPVSTSYGQSILALNASDLALVGHWQLGVNCCDYDFGAGPTLFHDAGGRSLAAALNKNGVVYAFNRTNATAAGWGPVWSTNISWYANTSRGQAAGDFAIAPAAFNGSCLFVGGGFARLANGTNASGSVRCLSPTNGTPSWTQVAPGIVRAGLAYANGLVYDAADAPNNDHATLEVRDARTGEPVYRVVVNGTINGAPSVVDGAVLFGSGNWSLSGPGILWALTLPLSASPSASPVPGTNSTAWTFGPGSQGGLPPYRYAWSFGDGSPSNTTSRPTHRFASTGTFAVSLLVSDATGASVNRTVWVAVPAPPLAIGRFGAYPATVDAGSATTLVADVSGGAGLGYTYSYTGLPFGCASQNVSVLTCTPTSLGPFVVRLHVGDPSGGSANATTNFTVVPAPSAPLVGVVFIANPSTVVLGGTSDLLAVTSGGTPPLTWSYSSLPPGCVSADVNPLPCRPSAAGNFELGVVVSDASGDAVGLAATLNVTTPIPLPVNLTTFLAAPSPATVGQNVTWVASATGGQGALTYAYANLPPGCASVDRPVFVCAPTAAGLYTVRVTIHDTQLGSANRTLLLEVDPGSPPAATGSASGPDGTLIALSVGGGAVLGAGLVGILVWVRRGKGRAPASP